MAAQRFSFAFDPPFRGPLGLLGVRDATSEVLVDDEMFDARFGRWRVRTPTASITDVQITRAYRWFKAIGPRGSLADRGATFGSTTAGGVCVCFHEPVTALAGSLMPHPALTVTVADVDGPAAALRDRIDQRDSAGSGRAGEPADGSADGAADGPASHPDEPSEDRG